jgi:hypothetical protein
VVRPLLVPKEGLADSCCCFPLHGRGDVAVEVAEQACVGMSESFGCHFWRYATRKHQRCTRMAETMSGESWKSDLGADASEQAGEVLRVVGTASCLGEHEVGVQIVGGLLFVGLEISLGLEDADEVGVDVDRADRVVALA